MLTALVGRTLVRCGLFLMTTSAVLCRLSIKTFHAIMAVSAEVLFCHLFFFHFITAAISGKQLKMTCDALDAPRFQMVVMTEVNGVGAGELEGDVASTL